jgi:anti-anti-sigma factor
VSGCGLSFVRKKFAGHARRVLLKSDILQVLAAGPTTIVAFQATDILEDINVAECRDEVIRLVEDNATEVICFELSRVRLIPSGMLGLLASLRQMDLEVRVLNPSPDVREVLSITNFDKLITIEEVQLDLPT